MYKNEDHKDNFPHSKAIYLEGSGCDVLPEWFWKGEDPLSFL